MGHIMEIVVEDVKGGVVERYYRKGAENLSEQIEELPP
jgi:hypothetical protein